MGKCVAQFIVGVFVAGLASIAPAEDVPTLLKRNGCPACHHETRTLVGPSFKVMADRHRSDPQTALTRFAAKLRAGSGHPTTALDDGSIRQLTEWILQR